MPGGQGPGLQCNKGQGGEWVQHKNAESPREGGGVARVPCAAPRNCLASLEGQSVATVRKLEEDLNRKRSAKDQKATLKDFFRISAEIMKTKEGAQTESGLFTRADKQESVLKDKATCEDPVSAKKKKKKKKKPAAQGHDGLSNLFGTP